MCRYGILHTVPHIIGQNLRQYVWHMGPNLETEYPSISWLIIIAPVKLAIFSLAGPLVHRTCHFQTHPNNPEYKSWTLLITYPVLPSGKPTLLFKIAHL